MSSPDITDRHFGSHTNAKVFLPQSSYCKDGCTYKADFVEVGMSPEKQGEDESQTQKEYFWRMTSPPEEHYIGYGPKDLDMDISQLAPIANKTLDWVKAAVAQSGKVCRSCDDSSGQDTG